ncbi:MAG TPA: CARDB domain-containing protein, partial [Salinimicrobium sp.]|nr:CARDB domain-containing protein [Salinimicrobium sp.]
MVKKYLFLVFLFLAISNIANSQVKELAKPVFIGSAQAIPSEPLAGKKLLPPTGEFKIFNPRDRGSNKIVPGKGTPKNFDAAWQKQPGHINGKEPLLSFDAATSGSTPTDPTGAVGPNHYVNAWNYSFAIYDKQGNILLPPTALSTIGGTFEGEKMGDPIVFYDEFADRFLITQFSDSPNSFLLAVSKGPDPVNDGWYTYRFRTGNTFPDYPKFSVWSDGYYITTNKDSNSADSSEVIYVLERDKILQGLEAGHVGFPLPGVNTNGFYSPAGFFVVGDRLPPPGNSPIVYFQDDAWMGVNEDHLKIWLVNVNWEDIEESTIEESQELGLSEGVSPFNATFDGGSFTNLSQVGDNPDVDALQGAIMYMTQFRMFPTHNSVVMNFVVDVDGSAAEHAGIRWYELRQDAGGGPWKVYQEGTYAPDNSDRWCGSIGIDSEGNIGMGFTILNDDSEDPIHPSIKYTGRFAGDELGKMTIEEVFIVEGKSPNPSFRYGDYAQLTVDPEDNKTFWFISEYFVGQERRNRVGVFRLAPDLSSDVGVVDIVAPISSTLGSSEEITITIRNFGTEAQSNFPVAFSIDGSNTVTEIFSGTIPSLSEVNFTFSTQVDLTGTGEIYEISADTDLEGDQEAANDLFSETIENLEPVDVGITSIDAPVTGIFQNTVEDVTVTLENFGGEPQTDIPLYYVINGEVT